MTISRTEKIIKSENPGKNAFAYHFHYTEFNKNQLEEGYFVTTGNIRIVYSKTTIQKQPLRDAFRKRCSENMQ